MILIMLMRRMVMHIQRSVHLSDDGEGEGYGDEGGGGDSDDGGGGYGDDGMFAIVHLSDLLSFVLTLS